MKLGFRAKMVAAFLVIIVTLTSAILILVQRQVEATYRASLQRQFARLVEQATTTRHTERTRVIQTVEDFLGNPRLVAALEAEDYDQFYYDLNQQALPLIDRYLDIWPNIAPFIRFIPAERPMQIPSADMRNERGLFSPIDEETLQKTFEPLRAPDPTQAVPVSGYYQIMTPADDPILFELIITPLLDFYGYLWGELVFAIPVPEAELTLFASAEPMTALWVDGEVYSSTVCGQTLAQVRPHLPLDAPPPATDVSIARQIDGSPYLVFMHPLEQQPPFPTATRITWFPLAEQEALIASIRNRVLRFATIFAIIGLLTAILAARTLTRALDRLLHGAHEVARGNLDINLPVRSQDEIGQLTAAFNDMVQGLTLRDRYRSVLDKVTDREVAKQLTTGELQLGGVELTVSVLFCDIRGFTSLTSGMPPQEVIAMLNDHMTALTRIAYAHQGVVDKFVGDEIMILFGAPRSYGEDALHALQCAAAMLTERDRLNRQPGSRPLHIGIGIATGKVVAGLMGSQDRLNYTVLGDYVNLAARLCSNAKAAEFLADNSTVDAAPSFPPADETRTIHPKGWPQPITVHAFHSQPPDHHLS